MREERKIETIRSSNHIVLHNQGDSMPTLFLHGFTGTGDSWKGIVSKLNRFCIAPDIVGHGKSLFNDVDRDYDIDDWCDDASLESNPYGFAKAEGEKRMRAWAESKDVRLITIHPSIVFGPILHPKHIDGSMSYLKHFAKGPPFVLDLHINFVDVRDVALAHVNALEKGENKRRYLTHTSDMWMKDIGLVLKKRIKGRWATKKLPKILAYIVAIFHPKLSIKQLKGYLGSKVSFDVGDTWDALEIKTHNPEDTIVESIESILHR